MVSLRKKDRYICGIVYSKSFTGKPVAKLIRKKYKAQRGRGSDGFGFYMPETNRLTHNPRENRAMTLLKRENKATEILFHHRYPTSTENVRNACHPFSTKHYLKYNYVGVHNGVLWNEKSLKYDHNAIGIKYVSEQKDGSFNDSESLVYDVARYIEGDVKKITACGSIAFVILQRDNKGEPVALYFGRNSSPLHIVLDDDQLTLSSEGKGEMIKQDTLYRFDYKKNEITEEYCYIPSGYSPSQYSLQDFDDELDYSNVRDYGYDAYGYPRTPLRSEIEEMMEELELDSRSLVTMEKDRLLTEADGDLEDAISLGEYELATMRNKLKALEDKVEVYDNATDEEYNLYVNLDDYIKNVKEATDKLRQELLGNTQMGFRLPATVSAERVK